MRKKKRRAAIHSTQNAAQSKEIEPQGNCEHIEDCAGFLRENTAAIVRCTVQDALTSREGRKQFYEITGLKEHFAKQVFQDKPEARAFITTEFERDLLEGLRQLADDEQENDAP